VRIWPTKIYGSSAGRAPIQVNRVTVLIIIQNRIWLIGLNWFPLVFALLVKGRIKIIAIDNTNAIAPPSLLGIERKIAYANKKYHSGWMCTGVTNGLAGIKFSVSPNKYGLINTSDINSQYIKINPKMSLYEKYGWKEILFTLEFNPNGLFDPVWWRKSKWIITIAAIIKGSTKWNVKNRVNVALSTANPPQIHWTSMVPAYGTADNKLVITVAAQNDIWPQIKTYPIKAVAITKNKIITPIVHVAVYL